ncbi:hypothetical protein [Nocardioides ungokensis]|uniref:hypothetical protein n=1 Tax=Nocardioides ungokensis TaxID=1643322 RepID=UPI001FECA527|nr:hypothetical protein [Nocardioides ungokensis]
MSPDGISLAHGIGGARDLPISPELAIAGGVAALVVSFTVLAVAWRSPRYDEATSGRLAPALLARLVDSTAFRAALRVVGMVLLVYSAVAAVLGKDLLTNPIFGIFYVWWWVGLVPLSLLLGPVWKAISPVRTINLAFAKVSGSDPDRGLYDYPSAWVTGPRLPACSRSCGWSSSTPTPPSSDRSGCGARSTSR